MAAARKARARPGAETADAPDAPCAARAVPVPTAVSATAPRPVPMSVRRLRGWRGLPVMGLLGGAGQGL